MVDTGIQDETLDVVLNTLLSTGTINVRTLSLPKDKKVLNTLKINEKDSCLISHEVLIFKAIIKKNQKDLKILK